MTEQRRAALRLARAMTLAGWVAVIAAWTLTDGFARIVLLLAALVTFIISGRMRQNLPE